MLNLEIKPVSVISDIRKRLPGKWRYNRRGQCWENDLGDTVRWVYFGCLSESGCEMVGTSRLIVYWADKTKYAEDLLCLAPLP